MVAEKGLLESIREQGNVHVVNMNPTKEEVIEMFNTLQRELSKPKEPRKYQLCSWHLLNLLKECKTKKDVKAIERQYSNCVFSGGEEVTNLIYEEYKRLGIK